MKIEVSHLCQSPQHLKLVASWIYNEFWRAKKGISEKDIENRLIEASSTKQIPLSLIATRDEIPAGVINLIENDHEAYPKLRPWIAALFVLPKHRNIGIAQKLIQTLLKEAQTIGEKQVYLGTIIPDFYLKLGAEIHKKEISGYCVMKFKTKNSD